MNNHKNNCYEKLLKILLIDCGHVKYGWNEPLGIEVLSASIKNKFDDRVEVEMTSVLFDGIPREIVGYDVVMISGNIQDNDRMHQILSQIVDTDSLAVVGGVYPTISAEILLKKYNDLICVIGEGEIATNQILSVLMDGKDIRKELESIKNIAYLSPEGMIKYTERESLDLSDVHYLPERKYTKNILERGGLARAETSRGCGWNKCSFCILLWKYGGAKWRTYPLGKVFKEIVELSKLGARKIEFTDEDFIGNDADRLSSFIKGIKQLKESGEISGDLEFLASTGVLSIWNILKLLPDLLPDLKSIGFGGFFIGIESGSKMQLQRYNKGVTPEMNRRVIEMLKDNDMLLDCGFIFFDPKMTLEEVKENIDFIERTGIEDMTARLAKKLRIIPHTEYCEEMGFDETAINEDSLSIPYKFDDERIEKIVNDIDREFKDVLDDMHEIQSSIRAENVSQMNDKEKENYLKKQDDLKKQRKREIEMIKTMAEAIDNDQHTNDIVDSESGGKVTDFAGERDNAEREFNS